MEILKLNDFIAFTTIITKPNPLKNISCFRPISPRLDVTSPPSENGREP